MGLKYLNSDILLSLIKPVLWQSRDYLLCIIGEEIVNEMLSEVSLIAFNFEIIDYQ